MRKDNSEFMSSLSSAVLQKSSRKSRVMVNIIFVSVIALIIWANFAYVDEITKGQGKVVPSSKVQIVQNLEGGIVSEILVKNADIVSKGTPLLKIENKQFESSYIGSGLKLDELKIRARRLEAEAKLLNIFGIKDTKLLNNYKELIKNENILFQSHMKYLDNQIGIIREQIKQNKAKIDEHRNAIKRLGNKQKLLSEEIQLVEPLVKKGIESKLSLLKLKKEREGILLELETTKLSLVKAQSVQKELLKKIDDTKISFSNRAQKELNELIADMSQIVNNKNKFADQVSRTLVKSPVNGKIKRIFTNTIGGVVKPGEDLVEIVPLEDELIIEAKIKPEDIAFLYPGQKAIIKFTAYDFAIHGGLEAKLTGISADTIEDEKGNSYYLAEQKTTDKFYDNKHNLMKIIPGMTASIDIIVGKKTIMDYILKPILKAKENALIEK